MSSKSQKENINPSPTKHDGTHPIRSPFSAPAPLEYNRTIMNSNSKRRESLLPLPSFSKKSPALNTSKRESLLLKPKPISFSKRVISPTRSSNLSKPSQVSQMQDTPYNSDMLSNPEEYVDILETYVKHDMMLDKQDSLNLNTQIISLSNQIRESNFEQFETNRERTKVIASIEELKLKCEEMDKKIVIKENEINNEINRHQLAINQKKKEIQERYEKEEREMEDSINAMINDLREESSNAVLKSERISALKASIQESINKVSERKVLNDSKLNQFKDELNKNNTERIQLMKSEISELNNMVKKLQLQKSKLIVDNNLIKELIDSKKRKFGALDEKMNLLHTYQGTLDDSMKQLKTRKLSLIDQLSDKEYELKEITNGNLEKSKANCTAAFKKLEAEELKRRKVEYQVMELRKQPRILIRSDQIINNSYEVFKLKDDCFNAFRFLVEEGLRTKYNFIWVEFYGELTKESDISQLQDQSFKLLQELATTELYSNYEYSVEIDASRRSIKVCGVNKISKSEFINSIQFLDMNGPTATDNYDSFGNTDSRSIRQFIISSDKPNSFICKLQRK